MVLERKKEASREGEKKEGKEKGKEGGAGMQDSLLSTLHHPSPLLCCPPFKNLDMVHQVNVVGRINY